MFVSINRKPMYLWRAIDHNGEVLDVLVQPKRDKRAALRLMRGLFKKGGFAPRTIVTDKLRSYGAAFRNLGFNARHHQGRWKTIGSKGHTSTFAVESARCRDSDRQDPRGDSSRFTPQRTTSSTHDGT